MEAKKRFKLYKSGKLWCCAAASQVATPADATDSAAATTDSPTNATPESTVTAGTQISGTAANDKTNAKSATAAATTTLNV